MCKDARSRIDDSLMIFANLVDLRKFRLHVDLGSQDIPIHLKLGNKGLRSFLARPIAQLIAVVEGLTGPGISKYTSHRAIANSIRRGTAMVGPRGSWDLVVI
jgi:hypothetical protein